MKSFHVHKVSEWTLNGKTDVTEAINSFFCISKATQNVFDIVKIDDGNKMLFGVGKSKESV
ncbi:MAG: hypothetical protein KA436_01765 [Oligoflexales bacterium]|nr:hypothetical protein [Oligoflexales bacterium]